MTRKQLNDLKIYNAWECAGHGNVYINYHPAEHGRLARYACWVVVRPGYRTTDKGHTRNPDHREFTVTRREDKQPLLEAAMAWCTEQYGITDWFKTPYGSWMSKAVFDANVKAAQETLLAEELR